MTVARENISSRATALARPATARPGRELALALFFAPAANLLVRLLLPLRAPPPAVVLANVCAGLAAALSLASGNLLLAAGLLQVKTLLDNADGRLARASGRVTLFGRYLDTEADLVVNAALFAALAHHTGDLWLSVAAFCALTFVLSVVFDTPALERAFRGEVDALPGSSGSAAERLLALVYGRVFAPQDRLVRALSTRRLERVLSGAPVRARARAATDAYYDGLTSWVVVNFGLTTQLLILGVALVLGEPAAYAWLVLAELAVLSLLQVRREWLARAALSR